MKGINGRAKGAAGEREFCRWLQKVLDLDETPTRNLEQTREGGADILGVEPFVFEIKRCEGLKKQDWWLQVKAASTGEDDVPVVAYRQNRQPWRFLISANYLGLEAGFLELEERYFIKWMKDQLNLYDQAMR